MLDEELGPTEHDFDLDFDLDDFSIPSPTTTAVASPTLDFKPTTIPLTWMTMLAKEEEEGLQTREWLARCDEAIRQCDALRRKLEGSSHKPSGPGSQ